jgi:signal transduction histidine kinase
MTQWNSGKFSTNGDFDLVTEEIGNHVYRVVQEATTNAIKHGKANAIEFTLLEKATLFVMRIEDNGKGLSLHSGETQTQGLGIRSMQARAKAIRGALKMESRTDRGYCVELSWPLPHQTTVRPADTDEGASSQ